MAEREDLAWDYTAENLESTPLVGGLRAENNVTFYGMNVSERKCSLTKRQLEYLVRNLEESASLLKGFLAESPRKKVVSVPQKTTAWTLKYQLCHTITEHIFVTTLVLQVFLVIVVSVLDKVYSGEESSSEYRTSVIILLACVEGLCFVFLLLTSVFLLKESLYGGLVQGTLVQIYFAAVLFFSVFYALIREICKESWHIAVEQDTRHDFFLVRYMKMLHFSLTVATFGSSSGIYPMLWYTHLLVILQIVVTLGCVMLFVYNLLRQLTNPTRVSTPPCKPRRLSIASDISRTSSIGNDRNPGEESNAK